MSNEHNILVRPVITEKMTDQGEKFNRFAFIVDKRANKTEIKEAIEKRYDVRIAKVRTMRSIGKKRSRYTRSSILSGRTSTLKKAIVFLKEGETIDLYSSI